MKVPKRTRDYRHGFLADLKDPEIASNYLNAALEESDEAFLVALRNVAEARQISPEAAAAGVSQESVSQMLSAGGNPRYKSLMSILAALGLKLAVEPYSSEAEREPVLDPH